jgi:hypothetical protein
VRELIVKYRRALVVSVHLALWTMALMLAIFVRFDFTIPIAYKSILPPLLVLSLASTARSFMAPRPVPRPVALFRHRATFAP